MINENGRNGEKLGEFLKNKREEQGLTLVEMGELIGVSSSYLNRIEKSQRKSLSVKTLKMISETLDISIEKLLEFY